MAYAREGADVVISYLENHEDAEETRDIVTREGRRAEVLAGDIGDPAVCQRLVDATMARFGKLDIVVNNAAYQGEAVASVVDVDPDRLERTFRTNILAMFHVVRAALPHLEPGASIINVTSIQATVPSPAIIDYAGVTGGRPL